MIPVPKQSFWWWLVIIAVILGVVVIGSDVQKLIFADAETTIISCDKFNGSYDIAYLENGEKKSILVDEKTARELFNKAQDDEAKKIAIDKCGLGEIEAPPISEQLDDLYKSVVRIRIRPEDRGGGTGFYLGSGTYTQTKEKVHFILTNAHIVEAQRRRGVAQTFIQTNEGLKVKRNFPFQGCHCVNAGKDLALIAIKAENMELEPLQIAKISPEIKDEVWTYGCSLGKLPIPFRGSCFLNEKAQRGTQPSFDSHSGRRYATDAEVYVFKSELGLGAAEGRSGSPILKDTDRDGYLDVISVLTGSSRGTFTGISLEDIREFLDKDCGVSYFLE